MMPVVNTQIETYGDLKKAVQLWADRDDDEFVGQIGNFINFAEKEIYRNTRLPIFQREEYLDARNGIGYIPTDLLEIKYIISCEDGSPVRRTSLEEVSARRKARLEGKSLSKEVVFAQTTGRFFFDPEITTVVPDPNDHHPDVSKSYLIGYYFDSKEFGQDSDSNSILTIAPDLLVYLTMKHAALFIQDDEGVQKWAAMAVAAIEDIELQAKKMEYSGSPLVIPQRDLPIIPTKSVYSYKRYY